MDTPPSKPPQADTRHQTIAVLALAAILRLLAAALVLFRYPHGWLFSKGQEMGLLAQSLLAGHGLSSPFGPPTGPTAFIAPGYPLLVAATFRIFGVESTASAAFLLLLHIAANLITLWLILRLARRYVSAAGALAAGLLWAVSPPLILLPTIFWDTSLAISLLTGFFALALDLQHRAIGRAAWLGLGAYIALTSLLNPALMPSLFLMLGWLAWQRLRARKDGLTSPLLACLAFAIVFSPWPIRNARVFHAFIPLRTTVGEELWMGNHDGATGYLMESIFPTFNPAELAHYRAVGEVAYTNEKSALAKSYIAAHPATFVRLTALRVLRFWTGTGTEHGSPLFALHATLTTLLGLTGLVLTLRRRQYALAALVLLPLLAFPVPYYITHAEFRYRIVLDALLTVFAAAPLGRLFAAPAPPAELPHA